MEDKKKVVEFLKEAIETLENNKNTPVKEIKKSIKKLIDRKVR